MKKRIVTLLLTLLTVLTLLPTAAMATESTGVGTVSYTHLKDWNEYLQQRSWQKERGDACQGESR